MYATMHMHVIRNSLEHDTALTIEWFEINYIILNKDKCHLLIAGHKYENLWVDVGGTKVWEQNTIENNLFFNKHVIGLCKRAGRKLSALKRLARILPIRSGRKRQLGRDRKERHLVSTCAGHPKVTNKAIDITLQKLSIRQGNSSVRLIYDEGIE